MKKGASSFHFSLLAALLLTLSLTASRMWGTDTPFGAWTNSADSQGIQYRYQVINPDSQTAMCVVQFRDLHPEPNKTSPSRAGDTDVEFRYDFVMPGGGDSHNGGSTRIWNFLGNYGTHNISICNQVSSVVVTKINRGL